jgi:hypothetical protein
VGSDGVSERRADRVRRRRRGGRGGDVVTVIFAGALMLYGAVLLIVGLVDLGSGDAGLGSAWDKVIAGAIFLAPVPLAILLGMLGTRRRRRRAVRAVLGEERRGG